MEVDYQTKTVSSIEEVKEFLVSIGENPRDYTDAQLRRLLQEGF